MRVSLRNAQRQVPLAPMATWRALLRFLLPHGLPAQPLQPRDELLVSFLGTRAMARINHAHLGHEGPTDVITFMPPAPPPGAPADHGRALGEILLCPAVALAAAPRFRVSPGEELARYAIHGILHLAGMDDHHPRDRAKMRRAERRLLTLARERFSLTALLRPPPTAPPATGPIGGHGTRP